MQFVSVSPLASQVRCAVVLPLACLLCGCSRPTPLPPPAAPATQSAESAEAARDTRGVPASSGIAAPVASTALNAPLAPSLCSPDVPPDASAPTKFSRIYSGPVLSAAVGTPPRAAIWSGQSVVLFEAEAARELPAPRLPEGATVEVFFGRDNQPRLMGFAPGGRGEDMPVYLRFRQGVFRPEPSELGPLAAPRGALYGVLGFADPEVVCRPRELCLVKRLSGWGRAPAHDAPARIVLSGGSVYALHATHVERLAEKGWLPLEPARAFDRPLATWLGQDGALWVTDRSAPGLYRLSGGRWESVASPIREPRAVFGRSAREVFVVGANGAAEFDGTRFRCVSHVSGPLHLVQAVGSELWLAGESGVFRSVR